MGNRLALFSLRIMRLCARLGIPCSLEQPASSWMLKLPPFLRAVKRFQLQHTVLHYCQFGEAWKKLTALLACHADLSPLGRK